MRRRIDRLLEYLSRKGISENKATVECGLAKGLIYQAKTGRADIGNKAVEKILATYSDLNRVWLLTGEGSMLNESETENPVVEEPQDKSIADKLFALVESQQRDIKTLLAMLKEKDEEISRLREELDARKRGCASDVAPSFDATAV